MSRYVINILATQDLNQIADYFSRNNVRPGENFFREFNRKCQQLILFPKSGKSYDYIRSDFRYYIYYNLEIKTIIDITTLIMDWRKYIHSNPNILLGKPVVKGTRLSVEFILSLFAAGWREIEILESYPTLNTESIRAVFAFAVECMQDEFLYTLAPIAEAS